MARHRSVDWSLPDKLTEWSQADTAILMDIRDELRAINTKLGCHRVPRALDDLHSLGVMARRRTLKKRRKAT
ncbi:MAG: hypothetical protein KIT48_04585 [Pseudolabrys sp.]|nr:hypothetical protein [Pseudolabrys sp.]